MWLPSYFPFPGARAVTLIRKVINFSIIYQTHACLRDGVKSNPCVDRLPIKSTGRLQAAVNHRFSVCNHFEVLHKYSLLICFQVVICFQVAKPHVD